MATAYRAVVARAAVREGDSVLVIGCGGVGLAAVAIARSRGAFVCAVDVSAASLDRALFHGADEVVDASIGPDKVIAAVARWSGGGVSVSIDALGSPQACRTGILALGRRGRHVQVGLLPPAAGRADVPMERVIGWELDVLGSHGMAAADYGPLLDDVASGRLDLGDLLAPGEPLGLEEAGAALSGDGRRRRPPASCSSTRRADPAGAGGAGRGRRAGPGRRPDRPPGPAPRSRLDTSTLYPLGY